MGGVLGLKIRRIRMSSFIVLWSFSLALVLYTLSGLWLQLTYLREADTRCDRRGGQYLNFDLAYPSSAIPDDFFPSDEKLYGYKVHVHVPTAPRTWLVTAL